MGKIDKEKVLRKFKADSELTVEERDFLNLGEWRLNQVKCLKCEEVIRSHHRHDFKKCKCGNIGVDGGTWYLKRIGNGIKDESYEDLSEQYESAKE